jgi:hypothetical protein
MDERWWSGHTVMVVMKIAGALERLSGQGKNYQQDDKNTAVVKLTGH